MLLTADLLKGQLYLRIVTNRTHFPATVPTLGLSLLSFANMEENSVYFNVVALNTVKLNTFYILLFFYFGCAGSQLWHTESSSLIRN